MTEFDAIQHQIMSYNVILRHITSYNAIWRHITSNDVWSVASFNVNFFFPIFSHKKCYIFKFFFKNSKNYVNKRQIPIKNGFLGVDVKYRQITSNVVNWRQKSFDYIRRHLMSFDVISKYRSGTVNFELCLNFSET